MVGSRSAKKGAAVSYQLSAKSQTAYIHERSSLRPVLADIKKTICFSFS
jgi:hypothetical protein